MDYYKVLGLDRKASSDDVRDAYKKGARKYHPDRKGGDESKFRIINEAYEVLLGVLDGFLDRRTFDDPRFRNLYGGTWFLLVESKLH